MAACAEAARITFVIGCLTGAAITAGLGWLVVTLRGPVGKRSAT